MPKIIARTGRKFIVYKKLESNQSHELFEVHFIIKMYLRNNKYYKFTFCFNYY